MRTTPEEVRKIMDETDLSDNVIEAYVNDANIFVNDTLLDKNLSEPTLTSIEKWLSAHFIVSTRERIAKEEGAGGAYIKYTGVWGEGFSGTPYGQQAMVLDTSGTLSKIQQNKRDINIQSL